MVVVLPVRGVPQNSITKGFDNKHSVFNFCNSSSLLNAEKSLTLFFQIY